MSQPRPPIDFETIDHLGCAVPDLDAAITWWKDMFGFELVTAFEIEAIAAKIAFLEKDGQRIEFLQLPTTQPGSGDVFAALGVGGAHHIGLRVQDAGATVAALESRGVDVLMPVSEGPIGFYAYVKDVSGLLVELVQYKA